MRLDIATKTANPSGHLPNSNQKLTADEVNNIVLSVNSLQDNLYKQTTHWVDGSSMDDSKVDSFIYTKESSGLYSKKNNTDTGGVSSEWFLVKSDGTTDDNSALQSAINICSTLGILLRLPEGVTYLGSGGGLKLPIDKPIAIQGQGVGKTFIKLSANCPRAFDCDANGLQNKTFRDISISGITIDANNVNHLSMMPATTVTQSATIAPDYAYTTLRLTSNANFSDQSSGVWFLPSNVGSAKSIIMGAVKVNGSTTDIQVRNPTSTTYTINSGDQITGRTLDHIIFGNMHGDNGMNRTGNDGLIQHYKNINIDRINVINAPTYAVSSLSAPTPSLRWGIGVSVQGEGSTIENVNINNVNIQGADCGIYLVGAKGTFIDEVHLNYCTHDRGSAPTTNYPSLNFMIGQNAYVNRVSMKNMRGKNAADVGIEIDQPMFADLSDILIENSYSGNYYFTNFESPSRAVSGPPTAIVATAINDTIIDLIVDAVPIGIDATGYLRIDNEVCYYVVESATKLVIRRFFNNSTNTSHAQGAIITFHEARRQQINMTRCYSRRIDAGHGSGVVMYDNSFLPLPPIKIRDCSHERIGNNANTGEGVWIVGLCPILDIEGYTASLSGNANSTSDVIFIDTPSFIYNNAEVVKPKLRIKNAYMSASGIPIGNHGCNFVNLNYGDFDVDIDMTVNGNFTGAIGMTRGFWAGNVADQVRGNIKIKFINSLHGDLAPVPVYLSSPSAVYDKLELDLDLSQMWFNDTDETFVNYIPYNTPISQANKIHLKKIQHSYIFSSDIQPIEPKRVISVNSNYTAKLSDSYIGCTPQGATLYITLPSLKGGGSSDHPNVTDGTCITIKDESGTASTNHITIITHQDGDDPDEFIEGTGVNVRSITTNYGIMRLMISGGQWVIL